MLISPPFLPEVVGVADDAWIDSGMSEASNNEGSYPVTRNLGWHGGVHLQAPMGTAGILPVRAIADGKVVFIRQPTTPVNDPSHPLNYDAGKVIAGWTSDGCVIISHDTEIGEGANGEVTYYSIYLHLHAIDQHVAIGKIYRKDKLGDAGYIYGKPNQIHFEIICNDTNLDKIVGHTMPVLSVKENGRTNILYGEIYFSLPVGTTILSAKPLPPGSNNGTPPAVVHSSNIQLYIGIVYAGAGFVRTYDENGAEIGTAINEPDFEYTIFEKATSLCPVRPSAGLEMIRFGRVIGTDVIEPANLPHWRKINYPGGQGWVNLAPESIAKFSDGDFPHWRGWQIVDDSGDLDSRVDSMWSRKCST